MIVKLSQIRSRKCHTLDSIIKKFSIIYGNVKSYDILMGYFYHVNQGEEETVTSFTTCVEGLLSYVRDKYPQQITHTKEQELLKDRLFHGCQKGIRDSVKYRHTDTTVDYMIFLEECRKAEDEDGVGKSKPKGKVKVAATTTTATSPSTYNDAFTKQLRKQQQQFDALMGKVQAMVTTLQSHNAQATSSFHKGGPSFGMRGRGRMHFPNNGGRGVPGGGGPPPHGRWRGHASTTEAQLQTDYWHFLFLIWISINNLCQSSNLKVSEFYFISAF